MEENWKEEMLQFLSWEKRPFGGDILAGKERNREVSFGFCKEKIIWIFGGEEYTTDLKKKKKKKREESS